MYIDLGILIVGCFAAVAAYTLYKIFTLKRPEDE